MTRILVLCIIALLLCSCLAPTPTTPYPNLPTKTGTATQPPSPIDTPTVTATPTAFPTCPVCPTCPPVLTPIPLATLYIRCYIDLDDSDTYTAGDEWMPCVLHFCQDLGFDAPTCQVITLSQGYGGAALLPGIHTVQVTDYAWQNGLTPSGVYCPAFAQLNPGANVIFECAFNEYAPVATRTRTPTTTPIIVPTRTPSRTPVPSATANAATQTKAAGGGP